MLALWLMACNSNAPTSSADAPFDISKLASERWIIDPRTDGEDGTAILVLSTEELPCGALSTAGDDLDELVLNGQGLLFMLEYGSWGDQEHGEDWSGLWMGGYGYSAERGARNMMSLAFSDGFIYFLDGYYSGYFGSSTWVNIETAGESVSGDYNTNFWSGSFEADSCGEWEEEIRDTGHTGHTGWDR